MKRLQRGSLVALTAALMGLCGAGCKSNASRQEAVAPEATAPEGVDPEAVDPEAVDKEPKSIPATKLMTPNQPASGQAATKLEVLKAPTLQPAQKAQANPKIESLPAPVADPEQELLALRDAYRAYPGTHPEKAKWVAARFEALEAAHRGTKPALDAKLWLLGFTRFEREQGTSHQSAARITDEILIDYASSPYLSKMFDRSYCWSKEQRHHYLRKVRDVTPHRAVRGQAMYALARLQLRSADENEKRQARETLELLLADYADVPQKHGTLGEHAHAALHPHNKEHLQIGKVAPEIVGRDADGNPMRLSDHRGKVVVLDFWGDW